MSLVFQFNLVCSDQWKQPLTSLAYFLGGLWGCLVSGQISDRYFSVSVQTFPVATPVSCYGGRMFFLSMSGSYLSANKALAKEMMICYTSWKKEVQIAEWYVIFILKCRYLHHISTLSKHEAFMVSLLYLNGGPYVAVVADTTLLYLYFRFGRKPVLFGSIAVLSIFSSAVAFAPSWPVFTVLLFLMGMGQIACYIVVFVLGMDFSISLYSFSIYTNSLPLVHCQIIFCTLAWHPHVLLFM